jgi:integrase/recombinase XerD
LPFLIYGKRPKTLPSVLSPGEVLRLLEAAPPGRDRVFLQVAYGCGLRLSELLHLRVGDIDSARMVVHVRQGKGGKDRLVPLSLRLLQELRDYWLRCRPRTWLFPGQKPDGTLSAGNLQRRFSRLVRQVGMSKPPTPGCSRRRADGAAHLGTEPAPSSARSLCRHRGRPVV